ncbi:MAG TPA: ABC transporter ATP-binding protein [Acidimicrobiales bacterium]|nr:ABC transporter ATP-binding protein [Acidimicrobiales bacterium]
MPTSPKGLPAGTVVAEHAWKRFRADRTLPMFQDQIQLLGRWLRGYRRPFRWVLRDVNLHVEPGRTYGLIGVNGSGKSTLLKMICQTTFPSAGTVTAVGRVGALLEVRSGIHPDLSGRQNVYLYGNIMGMSRAEVSARFDDIVDFAEIGDAVDRQVKFYSTGMAIRLGFAIAAFLEPDVLLVDEVLAVGDARFQQKCLERITQVVANGTTLFYVSHDLPTVEAVCERAMWLADSYVRADGPARDVVSLYRQSVGEQAVLSTASDTGVRVLKAEITGPDGGQILSGQEVNVRIVAESEEPMFGAFHLGITQGTAMPVYVVRYASSFPQGQFELRCKFQSLPLPKGRYSLWGAMRAPRDAGVPSHLPWQPLVSFEAFGPVAIKAPRGVMVLSPVYVPTEWELS